ncbi:hypothetical protein H9P43_003848 [Blastocladiella emersonii ATCC 22665]|nr:hypothetical protein H9P43_003848 [Blastocladiella emersonii ATCC 22665]
MNDSTTALSARVFRELEALRSSKLGSSRPPPPPAAASSSSAVASILRVKRSAAQETFAPTARALADARLTQALGGEFDYAGARTTLLRASRIVASPTPDDASSHGPALVTESIMARVRNLAAQQMHHHAAHHELSARAAAASARPAPPPPPPQPRVRSHPPPPTQIPAPVAPRQRAQQQPSAAVDPPPATPARATSPLRAPNKFYNVRVTQNPIFLRRTSMKPPHLTALPSPAPPLPPPFLEAPPSARPARSRSPAPSRRKPASAPAPARPVPPPPATPTPTPTPVVAVYKPAPRAAAVRTTTVSQQTAPSPVVRTMSVATQAQPADRGPVDAGTQSDAPPFFSRGTAKTPTPPPSPKPARGVQADPEPGAARGCQTDILPIAHAAVDTAGLVRVAVKGTQTVDWAPPPRESEVARVVAAHPPPPPPPVLEDEPPLIDTAHLHADLVAWIQQELLVRVAVDDLVDSVVVELVADLARRAIAEYPVAKAIQADPDPEPAPAVHVADMTVQADFSPARVHGATQVTPAPSPPPPVPVLPPVSPVKPDVVRLVLHEVAAQTSLPDVSLPTIVEDSDEEEAEPTPPPSPPPVLPQLPPHPDLADAETQMSPPAPPPLVVMADAAVQPATPEPELPSVSLTTTELMTPTPPPAPRVATPGDSLPPASPRTTSRSPGLVTSLDSSTPSHSVSLTSVSHDEIVSFLLSDGEIVSSAAWPPPGVALIGDPDDSVVVTDTQAPYAVPKVGGPLGAGLARVQRARAAAKRRALDRVRQLASSASSGISLPAPDELSVGEIRVEQHPAAAAAGATPAYDDSMATSVGEIGFGSRLYVHDHGGHGESSSGSGSSGSTPPSSTTDASSPTDSEATESSSSSYFTGEDESYDSDSTSTSSSTIGPVAPPPPPATMAAGPRRPAPFVQPTIPPLPPLD